MNPGRPHPPSPPLRADPRPLVILLGPTASGKSALAVALAERFGGEVVGADSRQIYRGTAVGTAQPSAPLRARVPHHMVDFLSPSESYNAARFAREARRAIEGIYARGHLPVAAGGSGLYVHALAEGLFEDEGVDSAFREGLSQLARRDGREAVHARLAREDPEAAAAIHSRDLKRVIRALELRRRWGLPLREVRRRRPVCSFEEPLYLGLAWPRELLYGRINRRASAMWEEGLLEETAALVRSGLEAVPAIGPGRESPALLEPPASVGGTREVGFPGCAVAPALEGLGYRHVMAYLRGELAREEALRLVQRDHRRYAKRQLTWFRRMKDLQWLDAEALGEEGLREEAARRVEAYLARRPLARPSSAPATGPERESPTLLDPPASEGGSREVGSSGCAVALEPA